jgi:hypothetical protein
VRTTTATWSGKLPGSGGGVPVVSRMARAISLSRMGPFDSDRTDLIHRCDGI